MSFDPWQETDILARDQFFGRPRHENSPERRLMGEVLLTAVEDLEDLVRTCRSADDPRMHELTVWFFGNEADWPYSFVNLCTQLNLDAGCIRCQLRELLGSHAIQPASPPVRLPARKRARRHYTRHAEAA